MNVFLLILRWLVRHRLIEFLSKFNAYSLVSKIAIYSITKKTSYDGITVYGYGDHIIVKTDNSISITK